MFNRARLPALYADFRSQASLNPDAYQANIAAWSKGLSLLASQGLLSASDARPSILSVTADESLRRSLSSRQYGQPMALGAVIKESITAKKMFPLHTFLHAQSNVFQGSWGSIPWAVMGWGLRQIGLAGSQADDAVPKGQYVLVDNVQAATKSFEDYMSSKSSKIERVFTKAQFYKVFSPELMDGQRLTTSDMDVLLQYMSRDKKIIEFDGQVIKVPDTTDRKGITDEDASIASLNELTEKLKHQTEILSTRVDELDHEAKSAVAKKNRVKALACLKAKKQAEASLTQRYATLNQLEEVSAKIEQAADNVQLIKVMESSTGVLKTLNAQVGGVDKIDSVMDELKERMSDTEELANILSESVGPPVDEAEIDDELAAMEKEAKEKQEAREAALAQHTLDKLPSVPADIKRDEREKSPTTETGIAALSLGS